MNGELLQTSIFIALKVLWKTKNFVDITEWLLPNKSSFSHYSCRWWSSCHVWSFSTNGSVWRDAGCECDCYEHVFCVVAHPLGNYNSNFVIDGRGTPCEFAPSWIILDLTHDRMDEAPLVNLPWVEWYWTLLMTEWTRHPLWICPQLNDTGPYSWQTQTDTNIHIQTDTGAPPRSLLVIGKLPSSHRLVLVMSEI